MTTSDQYRAKAEECFRSAQDASTKEERASHHHLAIRWLKAAMDLDNALPPLPPAPRLPRPGRSQLLADCFSDGMRLIANILDVLPRDSIVTFSADDLGLFSSDNQLNGGEFGAAASLRHIAEMCGCTFTFVCEIRVAHFFKKKSDLFAPQA